MIDLDDELERMKDMLARRERMALGVTCTEMIELITRIRQSEKDAARYRWIKANSQLGIGRCGVDWELHFDGAAPDNSNEIESHIDEAMKCSK